MVIAKPGQTVAIFASDPFDRYVLVVQLLAGWKSSIAFVGQQKLLFPQHVCFAGPDKAFHDFVEANPSCLVVWDCYDIQQPDGWQELHHGIAQIVLCSHPRGAFQLVKAADTIVTFAWPTAHYFYDARQILFDYAFCDAMTRAEFDAELAELQGGRYLFASKTHPDGQSGQSGQSGNCQADSLTKHDTTQPVQQIQPVQCRL